MSRAAYVISLAAVLALALLLRLPHLAHRPMHNDEGVNTVKFNQLWTTGHFEYDPNEYHGPTLYYFTLPVVWLSGAHDFADTTETTFRLVSVIFGVGLILLLPLVSDGIGRGGVVWAGLFTAVSPAFVYYSRYYIHEMPLIFFMFAAMASGWRYRRSNNLAWAVACGVFLGLSYATKETWVLALAATAGSAVLAATIWRFLLKHPHHGLHFRGRAVTVGALGFVVTFIVFFSGFFTSPRGPIDAVMTYFNYARRANGTAHNHPWNYYLWILLWWRIKGGPVWTEAAIVGLAAFGFLLAVFRKTTPPHAPSHVSQTAHAPFPTFPPFVRFVGFYTIFLLIAFSTIKYKTPWCLLGFLHGMILLAGFAAAQIVHFLPGWTAKTLATLVFLTAAGQLAWQADRATNNFADRLPRMIERRQPWSAIAHHPFYFEASRYNPYVYAHTSRDIFTLTKRMDELAAVSPAGKKMYIAVVTADCWPIPFYLRSFPNVGYWNSLDDKAIGADVIIGDGDVADRLTDEKAKPHYVPSSFGLRPGVVLWTYVRQDLFDAMQKKH